MPKKLPIQDWVTILTDIVDYASKPYSNFSPYIKLSQLYSAAPHEAFHSGSKGLIATALRGCSTGSVLRCFFASRYFVPKLNQVTGIVETPVVRSHRLPRTTPGSAY